MNTPFLPDVAQTLRSSLEDNESELDDFELIDLVNSFSQ